jgi:hypothetical protein
MAIMKYVAVCSVAAAAGAWALLPPAGTAKSQFSDVSYIAYDHSAKIYRHVRAESHSSMRSVVAPVRHGPVGDQVMIPGGSWHDCEITCEYTLRRVYLDFWEDQSDNFTSPGYFRYVIPLDY